MNIMKLLHRNSKSLIDRSDQESYERVWLTQYLLGSRKFR